MPEALRIETRVDAGHAQQRRDLGREREAAARERCPVERLLAGAIAREQQLAALRVEQRQREHAVEAREAALAVAREQSQHDLGVARSREAFARAREFVAQPREVVDLAVVREHEAPIGRPHRLRAGRREVEDRKARVGDAGALDRRDAGGVGPAMVQVGGQALEFRSQRGAQRVGRSGRAEDAGDAAHGGFIGRAGARVGFRRPPPRAASRAR